jgi:hypothetical protein
MPSPIPTPIGFLDLETLPNVQLEESAATAICDPDPSAFGDVFCEDGLRLGFRALRTAMSSIDRLYLHRPACASGVCVPEEVNRVRVLGWSGSEAFTILIDWDANTITVPVAGAAVPWPSATVSVPPDVRRPKIESAPPEIARREPYPFCGRAKPIGFVDDEPGDVEAVEAINVCFFDAVLDGRPVEMIDISAVSRQPTLLRFHGFGRVVRYQQEGNPSDEAWFRREGWLVLARTVNGGLAGIDVPVRIE